MITFLKVAGFRKKGRKKRVAPKSGPGVAPDLRKDKKDLKDRKDPKDRKDK